MQGALVRLNAEQAPLGLPALEMGIGINTGEVIVGNIGSEQRTKYGAVGAPINLAYRIESQTVGGQVLLGPRTYELVRSLVDVRRGLAAGRGRASRATAPPRPRRERDVVSRGVREGHRGREERSRRHGAVELHVAPGRAEGRSRRPRLSAVRATDGPRARSRH